MRIFGRKNVQAQAIDELEALPLDNLWRDKILELFYQLRENLNINQILESDDQELVMRLQPLLQEKLAQVEQKGIQQGERLIVENLLRLRFGELDAELSAVIDSILTFPPEEFTPLLVQLSREELVSRFRN